MFLPICSRDFLAECWMEIGTSKSYHLKWMHLTLWLRVIVYSKSIQGYIFYLKYWYPLKCGSMNHITVWKLKQIQLKEFAYRIYYCQWENFYPNFFFSYLLQKCLCYACLVAFMIKIKETWAKFWLKVKDN